jgi:hypothetical protein
MISDEFIHVPEDHGASRKHTYTASLYRSSLPFLGTVTTCLQVNDADCIYSDSLLITTLVRVVWVSVRVVGFLRAATRKPWPLSIVALRVSIHPPLTPSLKPRLAKVARKCCVPLCLASAVRKKGLRYLPRKKDRDNTNLSRCRCIPVSTPHMKGWRQRFPVTKKEGKIYKASLVMQALLASKSAFDI